MNVRDYDPSDDMFADTRMSFGEHIEELRTHLIRAIAGFAIAMVFSFFLGRPVLRQIIIKPVEDQLEAVYDRRYKELIEDAKSKVPENDAKFVKVALLKEHIQKLWKGESVDPGEFPRNVNPEDLVVFPMRFEQPTEDYFNLFADAAKKLGMRPTMKTMNVTEAFIVYFKVSIYCGLVLASPWFFYQLWAFVAAGLYPHEKRYVHVYLPLSLGLFLAGVLVCQFVVMPKAVEALLFFNEWLNLEPDLRLNEWLSFA